MPHNFGRWTPKEAAYLEHIADLQVQERGQLFDPEQFPAIEPPPTEPSLLARMLEEIEGHCDEPYERRYDPATNPDANFFEIIHIRNMYERLGWIMGVAASVAVEEGLFGIQQSRGDNSWQ